MDKNPADYGHQKMSPLLPTWWEIQMALTRNAREREMLRRLDRIVWKAMKQRAEYDTENSGSTDVPR